MFILRILNLIASYTSFADPPESIESGNYGNPPRATWWLKQSVIYFMALFGMKTCVLFAIQLLPFIVEIGNWALRWTEGNTGVQIFFVMLLFPVTMNAIQYYIIDGLIKKPSTDRYSPANNQDDDENNITDAMMDDDRHRRSALLAAMDDSDTTSDSDDDHDAKVGGRDLSSSEGSSNEYYRVKPSNHIPSVSTASENSHSNSPVDAHSPSVKLTARRVEHVD